MQGHDFLVVVPTCGEPDTLPSTVERLLRNSEGTRTRIVLMVNPVIPERAKQSLHLIDALNPPEGIEIDTLWSDVPLGFAKAVNRGLEHGTEDGIPDTIVVLNDDVNVTSGWLQGLRAALDTETVRIVGEPPQADGQQADRPVESYGKIGLAGPGSDNVGGNQSVSLEGQEAHMAATDTDQYAWIFRQNNAGNYMTADFLSGFCLAVDRDCYEELLDDGKLFDERFGIGGFEDNDLCVRAEALGWRCVIAGDVFVHHRGHQTLDKHFTGQKRGLANRLEYYRKWAVEDPPEERQRIIAMYRMKWTFANDLHLTRASFIRASQLCNGIAVLLTGNPLEISTAHDWGQLNGTLQDHDVELLKACSDNGPEEARAAFQKWAEATVQGKIDVKVEITTDPFNERDERNKGIALAESMDADWIWSIDHDEVPEDRITRHHVERLMSHPDPMVRSWDVGWLNHWNTQEQVRVDPPWADGTQYATGMRGFRIWRSNGRRIASGTLNGLHCGNAPAHDPMAVLVSGIRMRHFGYVRSMDRAYKQHRYRIQDPSPDPSLTGNKQGYTHLTHEEGMIINPFVRNDGIVASMLVHDKEEMEDVARWLNHLYGVVDHIVLVWTGEEPVSGDWKELGEFFSVTWEHHPFEYDLGACRNTGVNTAEQVLLKQVSEMRRIPVGNLQANPSAIGWFLFFDPDEWFQSWWDGLVSLRRMAECSDAHAFMFRFANLRPNSSNEAPTSSENMRMVRLNSDGSTRMSNRVHESFEQYMEDLRTSGRHPQIRYAPYMMVHRGLAGDDEYMEEKLQKYTKMLVLQLEDDPMDGQAWMSLGLQYGNEGCDNEALECLHRSVACAGDKAHHPYKELALWHMRRAKALFYRAVENLSPSHPTYQFNVNILDWLRENAPPQPRVGLARRGEKGTWIPELPEFPMEVVEEKIAAMKAESGEPESNGAEAPIVPAEASEEESTSPPV